MTYHISSRLHHHYLGNANPTGDKEVHDLTNEKGQCQIDTILKNNHAVAFSPDTKEQAHKEGYDNCAWCIGNSKR
jgi:hypothetical protein